MLHRLIEVLMDASRGLGMSCECRELERIAVVIHRTMSYQSRQFHTMEHIFGFLDGADAETVLAAVFHDLVYFQIDDGLPPDLAGLLSAYVRVDGRSVRLSDGGGTDDAAYRLCLGIFGFDAGQELDPYKGLNEFLSALCMARLVGAHASREVVVAVAACIEASIPFRRKDPSGGPADKLAARLRSLAAGGLAALDEESIDRIVGRSVDFGNVDVKDFSLADAGLFLNNTWKLLPESNAGLRRRGTFSISEYRIALQKTRAFFLGLDPASVYHSYKGHPDEARMRWLADATRRNLALADTYLRAKLLATALLEAAAMVSGGDAPVALFMGDIPAAGKEAETLLDKLPPSITPPWLDANNEVYRLLRDGRLEESSFDLRNSPLALYLYDRLEPREWAARSHDSEAFFEGSLEAGDFLARFPHPLLADLIRGCADMVPTRKKELDAWLASRAT
jgi:hypothetical protein